MAAGVDMRNAFQECLNRAIVNGQHPSHWIGLADETRAAIEAVAEQHPDATADHIADAYDAFAREHEPSSVAASPPAEEPHKLEARRGRFRRA
jgi:hypothetical protein